ncbi:MAG: hypothetical protein BWY49_00745 [Candidatus Omnitrophica bacterium ADurb.Bin314]|jgi:hypothetical protein|nr:MAG: hypothetical protein BWY49_00745 [Candidatus Omnitrophica bacterium ADurb.Bin314]
MKKILPAVLRWCFLVVFLAGMVLLFLSARTLTENPGVAVKVRKVFYR